MEFSRAFHVSWFTATARISSFSVKKQSLSREARWLDLSSRECAPLPYWRDCQTPSGNRTGECAEYSGSRSLLFSCERRREACRRAPSLAQEGSSWFVVKRTSQNQRKNRISARSKSRSGAFSDASKTNQLPPSFQTGGPPHPLG